MKRCFYIYFFLCIMSIGTELYGLPDCAKASDHPDVQRIISLLKERWHSIHTIQLQCTFYDLENPAKEPVLFLFKMDMDKDYLYFAYTELIQNVIKDSGETVTQETDRPKNPLEKLLVNQFKKEKTWKSISYYDLVTTAYYYYKGEFIIRAFFSKDKEVIIYGFPFFKETNPFSLSYKDWDPRIFWGDCEGGYYEKYRWGSGNFPMYEFFEKEGPYYYKEEERYKILWHQIGTLSKDDVDTVEVWIDKNNNIERVLEVDRYAFLFSPQNIERIENTLGEKVTCDSPRYVRTYKEVIFSDFCDVNNINWKFPLQKKVVSYSSVYDGSPEKNEKWDKELASIVEEWDKGKISHEEYHLRLFLLREKKIKEEKRGPIESSILTIDKNSLKINEPLGEEEFVPPMPDRGYIGDGIYVGREGTWNMKKEGQQIPWYRRYTGVLFVGGCIGVVLLLMFITRRYLGWGI